MKTKSVRSRIVIGAGAAMVLAVSMSACSSTPSLVGNWSPDDGSGVKVVTAEGPCQGMYYNGGKPLDIGGGMSCSVASEKGSDGRYSLVVSQPPNQASYSLDFTSKDAVTVYDSSGTAIYSMTRQ